MTSIGKKIRISRIFNQKTGRAVIVPMDHAVVMGPIRGLDRPMETFQMVIQGGADAVLMPFGQASQCVSGFLGKEAPSLILRLDWTNLFRHVLAPETGHETLTASVEDAVHYGADAVITYFFVGYEKDEAEVRNVENISRIARECKRYGMPFIAEPMARGKRVTGREYDPEYVKLSVRMAAELGADLIKTDYTGDPDSFEEVVKSCPVPVLIAGGPKIETLHKVFEMVDGAMKAGAKGVIFGRNVFQADNPAAMVKALRLIVHEDAEIEDAMKLLERQPKKKRERVKTGAYPVWSYSPYLIRDSNW